MTCVFRADDKDTDSVTRSPVIHFYEPFLAAYDKDLKNKRGVFFLPRPVVCRASFEARMRFLEARGGLERMGSRRRTRGEKLLGRLPRLGNTRRHKIHCDPFVCILDPAANWNVPL